MKILDKIQDNLKKVLKNINDSYDEEMDALEKEPYVSPNNDVQYYTDDDPEGYVIEHNKSWKDCKLHCIYCGNLLVTEDNLDFACSNDECTFSLKSSGCFSLRLHHPLSYNRYAGDSFSISYLK